MTYTRSVQYLKLGQAALVASLMLSTAAVVSACPLSLPVLNTKVKDAELKLEIAATPERRKCGLSRRDSLPADQGMLFVVPEPIMLDFWMTNTSLELSIAFLDETGHILSIQKMAPMQTQEHYRSPAPACYAIEVNQGWFDTHKVKVGEVIELPIPMMLLVR